MHKQTTKELVYALGTGSSSTGVHTFTIMCEQMWNLMEDTWKNINIEPGWKTQNKSCNVRLIVVFTRINIVCFHQPPAVLLCAGQIGTSRITSGEVVASRITSRQIGASRNNSGQIGASRNNSGHIGASRNNSGRRGASRNNSGQIEASRNNYRQIGVSRNTYRQIGDPRNTSRNTSKLIGASRNVFNKIVWPRCCLIAEMTYLASRLPSPLSVDSIWGPLITLPLNSSMIPIGYWESELCAITTWLLLCHTKT